MCSWMRHMTFDMSGLPKASPLDGMARRLHGLDLLRPMNANLWSTHRLPQ